MPVALLVTILTTLPVCAATGTDVAAAIAARLHGRETQRHSEFIRVLAQRDFLDTLYAIGAYAPLWSTNGKAEKLIGIIRAAPEDGLLARDYHDEALTARLASRPRSIAAQAEFDILLTDAFVRLAYNLRFGKANPNELDPNWNFSRSLITADPALWLYQAIDEARVAAALDWLRPQTPDYEALETALAHYRGIAAAGGWTAVPEGPTLKPGMDAPAVAALRARLLPPGGARADSGASGHTFFDSDLERAVRAFQRDHGLEEDGLVGKDTRAALNVSAAARVEQLRVNLERIRWVFRDLEDEFITVNIAAFRAAFIRAGKTAWRARAVVGRPYRQTPIFKAAMTHVIFNPTWTVPPTILKNDVLPAVRKDPGYLAERGLRVLSRDGTSVDPPTVDWASVRGAGFPYLLRQAPGPKNALGRVKFMFPNPHLVYLHDTPSVDLFERAERTFSSGCIRVERPLELAALLLQPNAGWSPAEMTRALADEVPRRFNLERRVTVMLLYLTAFRAEDGTVQFRRDVYDRDAAVLKALDGPFRFSPPGGYSPRADSGSLSTRRVTR